MSALNTSSLWNKSFILCLANNLFLFIFYFAQTSILPIYILNDLGGSLAQAGLAMTLFMASSIAVRPFSGLIIEKFGNKKTLFIAKALFCLFSLAYSKLRTNWDIVMWQISAEPLSVGVDAAQVIGVKIRIYRSFVLIEKHV